MTKFLRRFVRTLAAGLLFCTNSVFAIIGGEPDGNDHPNVGMIIAMVGDQPLGSCTGTLVSPTVVLTAAHCLDPQGWGQPYPTRFIVSFDSQVRRTPEGALISTYYEGIHEVHPGWFAPVKSGNGQAQFVQQVQFDLAVLVLNTPVQGITPAPIALAGSLDEFRIGTRSRFFSQVGYGRQRELQPPVAGGMFFDFTRNQTSTPLKKLMPLLLELQNNYQDARAGGGTCLGDSGGPVFLGTTIVAVHSYGASNGQDVCNNTGGNVRLDTESARSFLRRFGLVQ